MTLFDKLKAHIGGLVLLKTELYWYNEGKWDKEHKRICLLVDAREQISHDLLVAAAAPLIPIAPLGPRVAVLLFIDNIPKWVWVYSSTVELLK